MIVPTNRLLFWTAVPVPFLALGAVMPEVLPVSGTIAAAILVTAVVDAVLGIQRTAGIRVLPEEFVRMALHRPGRIPLRIRNERKEASCVQIGLPLARELISPDDVLTVRLPEGSEESSVAWPCTPACRGSFPLERCYFQVESPLGLWGARGVSTCRSEVRVYPNLMSERKRLAALFLRRGQSGVRVQRVVGHGREFERLREYVAGDSFEDIHWKATARRARPITKLFQVEKTRDIYTVIDGSRLSGRACGTESVLERFITSSLVVGLVAEQQGDRYGVLTFSDRIRRFVRAGSGRVHFGACRDAVYGMAPELASPDFYELSFFVRLRLRRRSLLMILTDLGDPVLSETFLRNIDLVCRQHVVVVCMVRQPAADPLFSRAGADNVNRVYDDLGHHMIWMNIQELARNLRHKGVHFSLVDGEKLSTELVQQYMTVKARQLL